MQQKLIPLLLLIIIGAAAVVVSGPLSIMQQGSGVATALSSPSVIVPAGTPSPEPSLVPSASPSAEPLSVTGVETFRSSALGVSFRYAPEQWGQHVRAEERGDTVYVYAGVDPTVGQFMKVFRKTPSETLEAAIRRQILAGFEQNECTIVTAPKDAYVSAEISYPTPTDPEAPYWQNYAQCNKDYARTNGIRYFLYDPTHPDRFYFVSIGQYGILASEGMPWQKTIRVE